jgi:hypothetical protein
MMAASPATLSAIEARGGDQRGRLTPPPSAAPLQVTPTDSAGSAQRRPLSAPTVPSSPSSAPSTRPEARARGLAPARLCAVRALRRKSAPMTRLGRRFMRLRGAEHSRDADDVQRSGYVGGHAFVRRTRTRSRNATAYASAS